MIDAIACAWSTAYAAIVVVALVRAPKRAMPIATARTTLDRTLLVRPCRGGEPDLARRLSETGGCRHVILAIGSADDAARPALEQALSALVAQGRMAAILVTDAVGPNHKADQIARCLGHPASKAAEFVVIADSDVDLEGQDLSVLVAPLGSPHAKAAACWSPPVEQGFVATRGDAVARAVLGASLHAFPLLAGIDRRSLVGKLFAIRRDVLDAVGGFEPSRHWLGEDVELARRLGEAGHPIVASPLPAITRPSGRTTDAVLARYTRWLQVIRAQRPALLLSYPLFLAATPLATFVLLAGLVAHAPAMAGAGAMALTLRLVVACAARRATGSSASPTRAALECVIADVTLLTALLRALVTRHVSWRGATLALGPGGMLLQRRAATTYRQHAGEEALSESGEHRRLVMEQRLEASRVASREGSVDDGEGVEHPVVLKSHARIHGSRRRKGRAKRHEEVRPFALSEDVSHSHGNDPGLSRDASDLRRARSQDERLERRVLAPLGEDPERAPGTIEQSGSEANAARTVCGFVEPDTDRPDALEERKPCKISGIHQRVRIGAEHVLAEVQCNERIPPGGVVGDEDDRFEPTGIKRAFEPAHEHSPEGSFDASACMSGKPSSKPPTFRRRDHGDPS